MQNINETVAILKHHVDTALGLIQSLKKKNTELESDNKLLFSENKRYKADIEQHSTQVKVYEEKMKSLETLLNEAQQEQSLLEQSVLNAISNLGVVSPEMTPASNYSTPYREMPTDTSSVASSNTIQTETLSSDDMADIVGSNSNESNNTETVGIF